MAIMNRLVQISPEECESIFSVFSVTELGMELADACEMNPKNPVLGGHIDFFATGETADYVEEKHHIEIWMIWPNASDKDESVAKQKAVMDKYPDTVAQMKQYIADNNITFEDTWWETYELTDADQSWVKTFTE